LMQPRRARRPLAIAAAALVAVLIAWELGHQPSC
jgi:hypothetical protein